MVPERKKRTRIAKVVKRIAGVNNSISVDILDANNLLLHTSNVEVPGDEIVHIDCVNGSLTLFAVTHNSDQKEDQLIACTLNNTGELSGTVLLASLKTNGGYLPKFKIAVSSNGQKVGSKCSRKYVYLVREGGGELLGALL